MITWPWQKVASGENETPTVAESLDGKLKWGTTIIAAFHGLTVDMDIKVFVSIFT